MVPHEIIDADTQFGGMVVARVAGGADIFVGWDDNVVAISARDEGSCSGCCHEEEWVDEHGGCWNGSFVDRFLVVWCLS